MMSDLERIYDAAFFSEWGRNNERYVESARVITELLWETFRPASVADLGCGCGVYLHFFQRHGARVLGIDGAPAPAAEAFPVPIERRDLTDPIENAWGPFDLTICLEVAEHIPEDKAPAFLDNLTRFGDRLVLSAAPPGQGGHHHVNEKPRRYWVERMAARDWMYDRPATGRLQEQIKALRPPFMWMGLHLAVFEKAKAGAPRLQDLPFSTRLPI